MSRPARTAGALPIKSGVRLHVEPAVSREEAAKFTNGCNHALGIQPGRRRVKHFSHFDTRVASLPAPEPDHACAELVGHIGAMQSVGWKGVRPQMAKALLILAQMARRDGYSLRVVAETALLDVP